MKIIKGNIVDATEPIIIHQVNCQNAMGSGVAKALFEKWANVKSNYHTFCGSTKTKEELLGMVQTVRVNEVPNQMEGSKIVLNCFTQFNYGKDGKQYTDYDAIDTAFEYIVDNRLSVISEFLKVPMDDLKIAIPYNYGCGLGGGDWEIVAEMIEAYFGDRAVIYKL